MSIYTKAPPSLKMPTCLNWDMKNGCGHLVKGMQCLVYFTMRFHYYVLASLKRTKKHGRLSRSNNLNHASNKYLITIFSVIDY